MFSWLAVLTPTCNGFSATEPTPPRYRETNQSQGSAFPRLPRRRARNCPPQSVPRQSCPGQDVAITVPRQTIIECANPRAINNLSLAKTLSALQGNDLRHLAESVAVMLSEHGVDVAEVAPAGRDRLADGNDLVTRLQLQILWGVGRGRSDQRQDQGEQFSDSAHAATPLNWYFPSPILPHTSGRQRLSMLPRRPTTFQSPRPFDSPSVARFTGGGGTITTRPVQGLPVFEVRTVCHTVPRVETGDHPETKAATNRRTPRSRRKCSSLKAPKGGQAAA